ncbi:hypothetical protein J4447_00515 [Candidatus Pacearchaeota archaeon]|nr:hypothetical protein [Candidatus Pacearchaeota archaeon]
MSKKGAVILAALVVLVSLAVLVSAQGFQQGFQNFWQGIIDILNTILSPVLGTSEDVQGFTQGEVLFMKALLFVIVLAITWSVLEMVPVFEDNTWVVVVVSIAVSILSTRFLATPGWIEAILLPYSALGIALTALVPLIIYFYFVEKTMTNRTARKASWIFGIVVFAALYITRVGAIGTRLPSGYPFNPAWIYLITAGICLLFFLFDGTIRRAFVDSEMRALGATDRMALGAELRRKITQAQADHVAGLLTDVQLRKMKKEFTKRLRAVESY